MRIVIPAEKLAAAVNKYLLPAAIRTLSQQQQQQKSTEIEKANSYIGGTMLQIQLRCTMQHCLFCNLYIF